MLSSQVITDEEELHKMSMECEPPLGGLPPPPPLSTVVFSPFSYFHFPVYHCLISSHFLHLRGLPLSSPNLQLLFIISSSPRLGSGTPLQPPRQSARPRPRRPTTPRGRSSPPRKSIDCRSRSSPPLQISLVRLQLLRSEITIEILYWNIYHR